MRSGLVVSDLVGPVLTVVLAVAIFLVDTLTPFDVAIAVLYVAVVLLSTNFLPQRGVLAVGLGCMLLTLASFAIVHGSNFENASAVRCAVSLCAIATTTFLALRSQRAAREAGDQAALLELTHDAIFVRDVREGRDAISYWNAGAAALYGFTGEEAMGRAVGRLLETRFPVPGEVIFRELAADGHWQGELVHTRRDGTRVVVMSRWSLQRDARGLPVAIMEINNDITERRQAEVALDRARSELAHVTRVATLGELAASIAHEVRQPLSAVVTDGEAGLRWLVREVPDLEEVRAALERMIASARRANEVVTRLRALAGKANVQRSRFSLNDIVSDILPLVERELMAHAVELELGLDPGLDAVEGDRVQLQQVVINLVMNAIQSMAVVDGRPRVLSIRSQRRGAEQPEAPEPSAVLEVRDTGTGIDPAGAARLFTAFYTTKAEGMGMGLSICRSIVEAHGGQIRIVPVAPPGAAFTIALPVAARGAGQDADIAPDLLPPPGEDPLRAAEASR